MELDRDSCYRALQTRDARFDGRFFTGVRSTGIYCRPICPARTPKLAQCDFMPSAAAAEQAGYRACLRCRPETSPDLAAWHGTATTVTRALRLIAEGALDDVNVEQLCDRLGVGERHLRRLFDQHVGASPHAVALTRRLLFAKQLITETQLSMADIALASGFGSIRRFNDAFLKRNGHAPSRIRRRSALVADDAVTLRLALKPPYDWQSISRFLATRAIPGVEHGDATHYARTFSLDGQAGWFEVRPWPSADDVQALEARISHPSVSQLSVIVERIRRLFDLGADPVAIDAHLGADPMLSELVAQRPGLRVPGSWDGFELAMRAILGQQVSVTAATRLAGRLVDRHGVALTTAAPHGLHRTFPDAARLAEADLVTDAGMPGSRARSLATLARGAAANARLFEPGLDLAACLERLVALPGIGPWTAHYIAMRALREPDAFPGGDVALLRVARRLGDPAMTMRDLDIRSTHWQPWRAYATLHLWMSETIKEHEHEHRCDQDHSPHARLDRVAARTDLAGVR
ncbi:DNA-3-methyladenine glycosylase 2 [soil metagenome]